MKRFRKWFHRWILDALIFHPPPLILLLVLVFGSVFTVGYWCAHLIDQIDLPTYQPYSTLTDNLAGTAALSWMPEIFPIDVVYTWVNGSDPLLIQDLQRFGHLKELERGKCQSANCFLSSYLYVENHNHSLHILEGLDGVELLRRVEVSKGNSWKQLLIFRILEHMQQTNISIILKERFNNTSHIGQLYWTSDSKSGWSFPWKRSMMLHFQPDQNVGETLEQILDESYTVFTKLCQTYIMNHLCVVECLEDSILEILKNQILAQENSHSSKVLQKIKIWPANLLIQNATIVEKDNDLNRFSDNEELRYSLRSLEKFMPWVRKVFIVTNGQVPYWLNLAHPRLTIVTHDDIFANLSHLPTFSSVAIETHIHRIAGLSEHFLYLNDDFLLGGPVWPEDFYSPSSGYKIYLSWNLPECSPGCPGSWLKDDYCDTLCNTTACSFDGGDCLQPEADSHGDSTDTIEGYHGQNSCSPICSDSWLADSYCDMACNVLPCGYDAGDCGIWALKTRLPQLDFPPHNDTSLVPEGMLAVWFNVSSFVNNQRQLQLNGSYSSSVKGVRTMAVNFALGVAVLVLKPNFTETVQMKFEVTSKLEKEFHIPIKKMTFNISYSTYPVADISRNDGEFIYQNFTFSQLGPNVEREIRKVNGIHLTAANSTTSMLSMEISLLEKRFMDGELTKEGFKTKKAALLGSNLPVNLSEPVLINDSSVHPAVNSQNSKYIIQRNLLWNTRDEIYKNKVEHYGLLENHSGNLPWEKFRSSNQLPTYTERHLVLKNGKRQLLDIFGESLLHVNRLYNDAYGFEARKVPAHLPYFFNKSIIVEMQNRYSQEFQLTSVHKFRHPYDMQFSFAYYYYLMSEKYHRSKEEVFDLIDTDLSGTWADREIRTFMALSDNLPVFYSEIMQLHKEIRNCSSNLKLDKLTTPIYERYPDSNLPTVTKELVIECHNTTLEERMKKLFNVPKFTFKTISETVWHFKMISSNISSVVNALDDIRKNRRKFICLNNDMDLKSEDNEIIQALLTDFFESLFPLPSTFELPPSYRNRFLYTSQLRVWRERRNFVRALIYASISSLLLLTLANFFSNKIIALKRRWCRRKKKERMMTLGRV